MLRYGIQPSEIGKLTLIQLDRLIGGHESKKFTPIADERALERFLSDSM